jgi:hypothetical protein
MDELELAAPRLLPLALLFFFAKLFLNHCVAFPSAPPPAITSAAPVPSPPPSTRPPPERFSFEGIPSSDVRPISRDEVGIIEMVERLRDMPGPGMKWCSCIDDADGGASSSSRREPRTEGSSSEKRRRTASSRTLSILSERTSVSVGFLSEPMAVLTCESRKTSRRTLRIERKLESAAARKGDDANFAGDSQVRPDRRRPKESDPLESLPLEKKVKEPIPICG